MLCTVVCDAYRDGEREQVRAALEILLSESQPDWSPKGVYAYWDYETHDLLYLGLASDLRSRFAQHNDLVPHSGGNKKKEIAAYFAHNDLLGFTILLQSKTVEFLERLAEIDFTLGGTAAGIIAVGEGQLIEMHRLVHGHWPPWNNVSGAELGKRWATRAGALLDVLAARRASLFVARRPLRTVADSFKLRLSESTIHAARMRAFMDAHEIGIVPEGADSDEIMRRIALSLMLREGHIVQDLDASDDAIRRWVKLLGDPEHWQREREEHRARLHPSTPQEAEVAVPRLPHGAVSDTHPGYGRDLVNRVSRRRASDPLSGHLGTWPKLRLSAAHQVRDDRGRRSEGGEASERAGGSTSAAPALDLG